MNTANKRTVALVQAPPVFLNLHASMDLAETLLREASAAGAWLTVFGETWLTGYPVWVDCAPQACMWDQPGAKTLYALLSENAVTVPGPQTRALQQLALETGSYICVGVHERDGATLYNTMLLFAPDEQIPMWMHRKLVPTYTERLLWGRGDGSTLGVMQSDAGPIGGLVCWEHWMPLARAAMHAQHERIHIAQWPSVEEMHQVASRHYAFEGRCHVLASGYNLTHADVMQGVDSLPGKHEAARTLLASMADSPEQSLMSGGSAVIAPDGSYVAGPSFENNETLYAEIDISLGTQENLTLDTDGHYSRPDVFSLSVNTAEQRNVTFNSSAGPKSG